MWRRRPRRREPIFPAGSFRQDGWGGSGRAGLRPGRERESLAKKYNIATLFADMGKGLAIRFADVWQTEARFAGHWQNASCTKPTRCDFGAPPRRVSLLPAADAESFGDVFLDDFLALALGEGAPPSSARPALHLFFPLSAAHGTASRTMAVRTRRRTSHHPRNPPRSVATGEGAATFPAVSPASARTALLRHRRHQCLRVHERPALLQGPGVAMLEEHRATRPHHILLEFAFLRAGKRPPSRFHFFQIRRNLFPLECLQCFRQRSQFRRGRR